MKLANVIGAKFAGKEAVEMKINGKVVWPAISYALLIQRDIYSQPIDEISFGAEGGQQNLVFYGITLWNGVQKTRERISARELTLSTSADWLSMDGDILDCENAENHVSARLYTFLDWTWNAHPEATYRFSATREPNERTEDGPERTELTNSFPVPIIWDQSRSSVARKQGDTVTLDPAVLIKRIQDYVYTSGYQESVTLETVTDHTTAVLTSSQTWCAVLEQGSGALRRYNVACSRHTGTGARTAALVLTFDNGTIANRWRFDISQE